MIFLEFISFPVMYPISPSWFQISYDPIYISNIISGFKIRHMITL